MHLEVNKSLKVTFPAIFTRPISYIYIYIVYIYEYTCVLYIRKYFCVIKIFWYTGYQCVWSAVSLGISSLLPDKYHCSTSSYPCFPPRPPPTAHLTPVRRPVTHSLNYFTTTNRGLVTTQCSIYYNIYNIHCIVMQPPWLPTAHSTIFPMFIQLYNYYYIIMYFVQHTMRVQIVDQQKQKVKWFQFCIILYCFLLLFFFLFSFLLYYILFSWFV